MIGTTLSHYKIVEELGRGGMGMVYKAIDTKLDREVALKFLPPGLASDPDAKARFIQEAKAASSLDHANICTIYAIGELGDGRLYIAMALYSGLTFKDVISEGPVSMDQSISITLQIASALERAHSQGIVHRDIKPANIMLTDMDEVKILDFGLAKLSGGVDLTRTGSTVGTAAYMSPEQVRALTVDYRTDLWSLGIIMYELISGSRPFEGEYDAAVGYSILNETPPTLSSDMGDDPYELEQVIRQLLAKDPEERPTSAGEVVERLNEIRLARDSAARSASGIQGIPAKESRPTLARRPILKWLAGAGVVVVVAAVALLAGRDSGSETDVTAADTVDEYSLAVLPFIDLSPDAELDYFGEGMAEELRNAMMGLGGMKVAARASSFYFKGKGLSPQAIGDSLSVGLVLEGTVRQVGENIRLTAELTDTDTGFGIWSNRYDERMDDALAVQDRITQEIVDALQIELNVTSGSSPRMQTEEEAEAYRRYLQGKFHYNSRTREGLEMAVNLFQEAIRANPDYAPAYAFLSQAYTIQVAWAFMPPNELLPLAIQAAEKSIELDGSLADGYAAMGIARLYNFEIDEAMRFYNRSLALRPDEPSVLHWKGLLLINRGQVTEGIALIQEAYDLDPLSPIIGINQVWTLGLRGDCSRAESELKRLRSLHGDHAGLLFRYAECLERVGRFADGIALFEPVSESFEDVHPFIVRILGRLYARVGRTDDALRVSEYIAERRRKSYFPISARAYIHAWLGDTEKALELFETGYQEKDPWFTWLITTPAPEEIVNDPRFQAIIDRLGLRPDS